MMSTSKNIGILKNETNKNVLHMSDVERLFTKKVIEYTDKGYVINPLHMSGSSSDEISHVELVNGMDAVRIVMTRGRGDYAHMETVSIVVIWFSGEKHLGIGTYGHNFLTVWNDNGSVVETVTFGVLGDLNDANAPVVAEDRIAEIERIRENRRNASRCMRDDFHENAISTVVARTKSS